MWECSKEWECEYKLWSFRIPSSPLSMNDYANKWVEPFTRNHLDWFHLIQPHFALTASVGIHKIHTLMKKRIIVFRKKMDYTKFQKLYYLMTLVVSSIIIWQVGKYWLFWKIYDSNWVMFTPTPGKCLQKCSYSLFRISGFRMTNWVNISFWEFYTFSPLFLDHYHVNWSLNNQSIF